MGWYPWCCCSSFNFLVIRLSNTARLYWKVFLLSSSCSLFPFPPYPPALSLTSHLGLHQRPSRGHTTTEWLAFHPRHLRWHAAHINQPIGLWLRRPPICGRPLKDVWRVGARGGKGYGLGFGVVVSSEVVIWWDFFLFLKLCNSDVCCVSFFSFLVWCFACETERIERRHLQAYIRWQSLSVTLCV